MGKRAEIGGMFEECKLYILGVTETKMRGGGRVMGQGKLGKGRGEKGVNGGARKLGG